MIYIICILPYVYYMGMIYILWLCIWIFEFILVWGRGGGFIRSLALGSDALILPFSSDSVYTFVIWIGMGLGLEAVNRAFSLDMVLGFLFITLFVLGVELLLGRLDRDNFAHLQINIKGLYQRSSSIVMCILMFC